MNRSWLSEIYVCQVLGMCVRLRTCRRGWWGWRWCLHFDINNSVSSVQVNTSIRIMHCTKVLFKWGLQHFRVFIHDFVFQQALRIIWEVSDTRNKTSPQLSHQLVIYLQLHHLPPTSVSCCIIYRFFYNLFSLKWKTFFTYKYFEQNPAWQMTDVFYCQRLARHMFSTDIVDLKNENETDVRDSRFCLKQTFFLLWL